MANNPTKKVFLFLPFLTYGGAERQGFLLAQGLHQQGYDVTVGGFKLKEDKYPLIADLQHAGIKHYVLPFEMAVMPGRKTILPALYTFINYLRSQKFDAVIPFTFWPNYLSAHAARFVSARCFWNQRSVDDHVAIHGLEKWLPVNKLSFISNSIPGTDFLIRRFGLKPKQITIVANSVVEMAPRNTAAYWRNQLQVREGEVVVTMVANFYPEKDFDTVIAAANTLRDKPYRFVFAGGGPDKQKQKHYKALCFDLNLANHISFLDNINDVAGLLQVTDIGLLSSKSEGCPNSILEYMYNSLPVVANDIEAITDVLGADYPFLFKTGDPDSLVQALERLSGDKQLRQQTGNALKLRVSEKYSQQKMVAAYIHLLEQQTS